MSRGGPKKSCFFNFNSILPFPENIWEQLHCRKKNLPFFYNILCATPILDANWVVMWAEKSVTSDVQLLQLLQTILIFFLIISIGSLLGFYPTSRVRSNKISHLLKAKTRWFTWRQNMRIHSPNQMKWFPSLSSQHPSPFPLLLLLTISQKK